MIFSILLVACLALGLAFVNGANDNAKTVATLIGGRTLSLNRAVVLSAATTFIGSVAAIVLAAGLVDRFGGKGIVDGALVANAAFPASVGFGAALTVLLATLIGMPISTTHAMVGAIVGIGLSAGALQGRAVWWQFVLPLLCSPLIAVAVAAAAYLLFRSGRRLLGVNAQTCLCAGRQIHPVMLTASGSMVMASSGVKLSTGEVEQCRQRYVGRFIGLDAQRVLDVGHLVSAAALSFARGLNDTPKIAALLIAAGVINGGFRFGDTTALTVTGAAIAMGGLLAAKRVARTMSYRITGMNDGQGFTANLVTAGLVILASRFALPVSTTHVSCGSLFGIGVVNRRAHWKMIGSILLAWVATLPVSAVLGALAWELAGG